MTQELKESQIEKQQAIDLLRRRYTPEVREELNAIDYRLAEYFDGLTTDVSVVFGDEADKHNRWELLCGAKFLRMYKTYSFNANFVRFVIKFREGNWEKTGKMWKRVSGGLKLPSTSGAKVYRWQPFQVFVLATVFGFQTWFNTQVEAGTKPDMLPSERERDGWVWDFRRLVNEFIMYGPRKIDKTGLSAYIQVIFFLFGDFNSETYSLAMTKDQSDILFSRTKFMLSQLSKDQNGIHRFHMTKTIVEWREIFQKDVRNSKVMPLTGGGKAPDGTNTELLNWDELGSDPYINNKSDMQAHINVCQSSMGMRRQPLTFGTTTAGTITSGPFIDKLEVLHKNLEDEYGYETGEMTPTVVNDGTMCLLLEPDDYERENEQYMLTSHALRRKINPMLGLVVQYDFYDREMKKASDEGGQKFAECIAKLFNVYQTNRVKSWIKGDRVRSLQVMQRIGDCTYDKGWRVFCGMDFSHGDDLFALSFLGVNYTQEGAAGRFFADTIAWVLEATMEQSPNRPLYEKWVESGWLHVCPGEVFDPTYAMNELAQLTQSGIDMVMFGFDPAQSRQPINNLKAWLQTLGIDAQTIEKMVVPVPQNAMAQNPRVSELEDMIKSPEQWLWFSMSPLWPWCFGNCGVEMNSSDLRRIVKGGTVNGKIDPVAALVDALYCFDLSEGRID